MPQKLILKRPEKPQKKLHEKSLGKSPAKQN
jgi:hypothetical protein